MARKRYQRYRRPRLARIILYILVLIIVVGAGVGKINAGRNGYSPWSPGKEDDTDVVIDVGTGEDVSAGSSVEEDMEIPGFDGETYYIVLNGDVPSIKAEDVPKSEGMWLGELDYLGRCSCGMACVSSETIYTGERESLGMYKPTGWHTIRYDDLIEDKYLYNRCHIIMHHLYLGSITNDERNLITGTRYFNVVGMGEGFENIVAGYIYKNPGKKVFIKNTPVFSGVNLVADGILMEAVSEDGSFSLYRYAYNEQPGIEIEHLTGISSRKVG